jgi:hypothetical protein
LLEGEKAQEVAMPRIAKIEADAKAAQVARDAEAAKNKPPASEEVKVPAAPAASPAAPAPVVSDNKVQSQAASLKG